MPGSATRCTSTWKPRRAISARYWSCRTTRTNPWLKPPQNDAEPSGTLTYIFDESASNFSLALTGCCQDQPTTGEYRLLIGMNAPDVLTGDAESNGEDLLEKPVEVQIGVKLQQIIEINESSEFYNAVVSLQMEWMDPDTAFSPDTCDCTFKTYTASNINEFIDEVGGLWPEFTIFNQQGNRWSQNKVGVIFSNGRVLYFERFTTNLQVDFDFKQYPFDTQEFTIKVDGVYPDDMFVFTDLPDFTEIAPDHGEDEFMITDWQTEISSEQASTRSNVSRFTFSFTAPRQLAYYMLQIFIPILLIIIVSYVTFFLRDYGRRIEVASANLLLFIAFSFSLADNYPRLGYVTFLDALMAMIFVINALVVIYNVWLRKLEMAGDEARAERVDSVLDWAYPVAYLRRFWWSLRLVLRVVGDHLLDEHTSFPHGVSGNPPWPVCLSPQWIPDQARNDRARSSGARGPTPSAAGPPSPYPDRAWRCRPCATRSPAAPR